MKKYIRNQRGNALIISLWYMIISILIMVLVLNIGKVFAIKQQANNAAEQAAIAATGDTIEGVMDGVRAFDMSPASKQQKLAEGITVEELINMEEHNLSNYSDNLRRMKAIERVVKPRMYIYPALGGSVKMGLAAKWPQAYGTATSIAGQNFGKNTTISISKKRIKVETSVDFESISDGKYIERFYKKINQTGYGPEFEMLQFIN